MSSIVHRNALRQRRSSSNEAGGRGLPPVTSVPQRSVDRCLDGSGDLRAEHRLDLHVGMVSYGYGADRVFFSPHKTCARCGIDLPAQRHQGNPRKWCSEACRMASARVRKSRGTVIRAESVDREQ